MAPPIFRQLSYEQARDAAAAEKKWLLLDFSAEWCQPCKHMDRTTWVAPEVVAWVNEHAVAIQLDHKSPAVRAFAVKGYPTVILLRDDKEFDRKSGAWSAAPFLQWLNGVTNGRTDLDELRTRPKEDLASQARLAGLLLDKGLDEEALELFAWLWEHSPKIDEAWLVIRAEGLLSLLAPLLRRSERAREQFRQFRDLVATQDDRHSFLAFVELNHTLGEDERTIAWLRSASRDQATRFRIHSSRRILEIVEESELLATWGQLLEDGIAAAEEHRLVLAKRSAHDPEGLTDEDRARIEKMRREASATFARRLARAAHAAERRSEASKLESWADDLLAQKN